MIGLDNLGCTPSLVFEDVQRLQRALRAGTSHSALAYRFGVSPRTIYRYEHAELYTATVAGHELAFIVWRPGGVPTLIGRRQNHRKVGQRRGGEHARTNG